MKKFPVSGEINKQGESKMTRPQIIAIFIILIMVLSSVAAFIVAF
ncbi:MAG: hypothetical protein Q8N08_07930 [Methanobacteriaceae archaeon]|nr:hypothetical protein [Methanobacteriaceae archaeon]